MDPKQKTANGGQEGQAQDPAKNAGFNADSGKLSTGANVSRTMDSLNAESGATYGGMTFTKHSFDKIEPGTGDIILNSSESDKPRRGIFGGAGRKKSTPSGWDMNTARESAASADASEPTFTTNRSSTAYVPSEFQNPAPEKKPLISKKILIVLAVVVVLVAGGVGGYFLVTQNMGKKSNSGSGSQTVVTTTAKDAYSDLVNYIIFGNEDTSSITASSGEDIGVYDYLDNVADITFANLLFVSNKNLLSGDEGTREETFNTISSLYEKLDSSYDGDNNIYPIMGYYLALKNLATNEADVDVLTQEDYTIGQAALASLRALYTEFYGEDNESGLMEATV